MLQSRTISEAPLSFLIQEMFSCHIVITNFDIYWCVWMDDYYCKQTQNVIKTKNTAIFNLDSLEKPK